MIPNAVTLISTKNNVMTAAWISEAEYFPRIVSVAIDKSRLTYQQIKAQKSFGMIVLNEADNVVSSIAGSVSGKDTDKIKLLKKLGYHFTVGKKTKNLLGKTAVLNLECKLIGEIEAGHHVIFVGQVVKESRPKIPKAPIIYYLGKYYKIGNQIMKPGPRRLKELEEMKLQCQIKKS